MEKMKRSKKQIRCQQRGTRGTQVSDVLRTIGKTARMLRSYRKIRDSRRRQLQVSIMNNFDKISRIYDPS